MGHGDRRDLPRAAEHAGVQAYFTQNTGRAIVGAFAVVLALSFIPAGSESGGEPGFAPPVRALAKAPITVLAQVAGTSIDDLKAKLQAQGLTITSDQQSVADLVGSDLRKQIGTMSKVLPAAAKP